MIVPKKSLGQHFLIDPNIVRKIIETAEVHASDEILEIGPGKGILTRQLAERSKRVIAVEIDRQLALYLKQNLGSYSNLEIIPGDILKINFDILPERFKVVANIPYQISSPLLTRLIHEGTRISSMTLMIQKEVADRIVALPGIKNYGPLSIYVQFYAAASSVFHIQGSSFSPPPKVTSSVIKIIPLSAPRISPLSKPFFFKLVKAAFAHRRKSIRNSLKDEGYRPEEIDPAFRSLHLDSGRRAETLTIEEFGRVSDSLCVDKAPIV
ncbi:MAG: ribosomal RNA small subunit methyltransferase A [Nitrospirae bacterium]|nr:ribosomal RNA small subunit methyltransferase A [Nitrospirota bacterium]